MTTAYLLQNQDNLYLDKSGEWVEGDNSQSLYRTPHRDEAINKKVEFSVKNADLRLKIAEAKLLDKGALELLDESEAKIQSDKNDKPEEDSLFSLSNGSSSVNFQSSKQETDTVSNDNDFKADPSGGTPRLNNIHTNPNQTSDEQIQRINEDIEPAQLNTNQPETLSHEALDKLSSCLESDEQLNTETTLASMDDTNVSTSMSETPIEDAVNDEPKKANESTKISSLY